MKFSCVVATDKATRNGDVLTKEALKEMASMITGKLITLDFRKDFDGIIGKVEKAILDNCRSEYYDAVVAIGNIDDGYIKERRSYCVPQFEVDTDDVSEENGVKVIRHIKDVLSFGLTENPSDKFVTPIEEIEGG